MFERVGLRWAVLLALGCEHVQEKGADRAEFDAIAAHLVARRAVAKALVECDERAGPPEPGQVEVQFEPVPRQAHVLPETLSASARGACIERVVRFETSVTEFRNSSGSVREELGTLPSRPPESAYPKLITVSEPVSQRFDLAALQLGLFRATRRVSEQCRLAGGPTGKGQIALQLGNDGQVQSSELLTEQFRGTPTGECVQKQFALLRVPPFVGTASPVLRAFVVGEDAPADSCIDYEAAERTLAEHAPSFDAAAAARALKDAALAASACRARGAWGWGEVQVDFLRYGSVDRVTLLTERFKDTEAGTCVTNAFRQARVPVFGGPSSILVQGFEVQPPSPRFDEAKAQQALAQAAEIARHCAPKGGPTGTLEVGVRFDPDGHARIALLTPAFRNTLIGSCVELVFRRAVAPAFEGPAPPLFQQLEITEPASPSSGGVGVDAG